MALHRIERLTLGVPDVASAAGFYEDFGLLDATVPPGQRDPDSVLEGEHRDFATTDAGAQLRLVRRPTRRLLEAVFAADSAEDCHRTAGGLSRLRLPHTLVAGGEDTALSAREEVTGLTVRVVVRPRTRQTLIPQPVYNGPGRPDRLNARAAGVIRTNPVRPRRLGHFVLGTTDFEITRRFFVEGLGFKVSDIIKDVGVFLRCSTDHHNLLVQRAPVPFLHHTSWQVDDIDEIGRGAVQMLEGNPDRHVWGLGRHYAGSNFFWYLKDPAGNFAEYHSDMDCIPEDSLWTPEVLEGARGLFTWGPPPPPSFLNPDDLADLMIAGHS